MTPPNPTCRRCHQARVPGQPQWRCCSTHTPSPLQWVCDPCAVILHPEKAAVVTHAMFNDQGVFPCCGVHKFEAPPEDRVAVLTDTTVTCTGKKRYREKGETGGLNRAQRRAAKRAGRKQRR